MGVAIGDVSSTLFFGAASAIGNDELWTSDGTVGGTGQVADILVGTNNGSSPAGFFVLNNLLCFNAGTSGVSFELWRSDGTAGGTLLAKDICTTSSCFGTPRPR